MKKNNILGLPILLSLVVGNMIGTGIYVLPASLAAYGSISILSWVFTGIGALFIALIFAKLNQRFPQTGGPFIFCNRAFGKLTSFIIGYIYWISNMVSIAAIAVSSISYMGYLTPYLNASSSQYRSDYALILELFIVWLFTLINIIGIKTAGFIQLGITIIKVIPLIIIIIIGFAYIHIDNIIPFTTGNSASPFAAISYAATLTFWGFIGIESATIPADNTKRSSDVYKATVLGTLITLVIYILSTLVLMGMIPIQQLQNSQFPYAVAGTFLFGDKSAALIALCAVISGLGALNVCILIQGQIAIAMGKENFIPTIFSKKTREDVPVYGQLLSSSIISLFLIMTIEPTLLSQFNNIALIAGLLTLITYLVTMCAEIKFAWLEQLTLNLMRSSSLYIAIFASLYSLWMISYFSWPVLLVGLIVLGLTFIVYIVLRRQF